MQAGRVTDDGLVLRVRLTPKGGRDALEGIGILSDGTAVLKARVRAAPEDGAANAALIRLVADALGVPVSAVSLRRGAAARQKELHIAGDGPALAEALARRIGAKGERG